MDITTTNSKPSPRELGGPHDEWRDSQWEAYSEAKRVMDNNGGYVFLEAPTGTGKSLIATALGYHHKILVCVETLGLLSQYERQYGFTVVRGKQEYECVHEERRKKWKREQNLIPLCSDCPFDPMKRCPSAYKCLYLQAKHNALHARRAACTYRYIGVSSAMKDRSGNVVFDEAHDSVEELIRFNTIEITYEYMRKLGLPQFPINWIGEGNQGDIITDIEKNAIYHWLKECMERLARLGEKDTREGARYRRALHRYSRISDNIYNVEWFLYIGDAGIELRALDAKQIAQSIFKNKQTKLLMSATIGKPDPLAYALGIDEFEFHTYPHPVPKEYRMVKDLKLPRMTQRNLHQNIDYPHIQVKAIHKWIKNFPPTWRGVIVTTSYRKIEALARLLQPELSKRRFFVQYAHEKVGDVVARFITNVREGDIMIGTIQGMGSGLDLYGDLARWIVIAGTPHESPVDEYAKARRQIFGGITYQYWATYNAVVQACGRVSRAEKDDSGNWLPNYAALADGSTTTKMAMKYYPPWFLESLI